MKSELKRIGLALTLSVVASGMSSCSLLGKGKYASQWEIESEVPAALSSGRASTPSADAVAGNPVKSNLDGLSPASDGSLDLPVSENGSLMDIPKPDGASGGLAYQSPPEMLNVPSVEGSGDLPYAVGTLGGIETLLPAPPPAVTEEELNLAPAALAAASGETTPPATDLPLVPTAVPEPTPVTAPSIPLLYGRLDLAPFLNAPAPLAVNMPPVGEATAP